MYEGANSTYIHTEPPIYLTVQTPGNNFIVAGLLYPDLIRSDTGDVYEIEPLLPNPARSIATAVVQATIYRLFLQRNASLGLLPSAAPNDWNTVFWSLGDPVNFPLLSWDTVTNGSIIVLPASTGTRIVLIPWGLELVAVSPAPGTVVWWYQPSKSVSAAALAAILAKLAQHFLKNLRLPVLPPVPEPQPLPIPLPQSLLPIGGSFICPLP